MIKIERVSVMNFENAIRGARNPLNSWAKSDSYYNEDGEYVLGDNDLSLAKKLAKAGIKGTEELLFAFIIGGKLHLQTKSNHGARAIFLDCGGEK